MNGSVLYSNCGLCQKRIRDRYYVAMGSKKLHNECIYCKHCKRSLSNETSCYEKEEVIYCKGCYNTLFPETICMCCRKGIPKNNLAMQAKDMFYHISCFRCTTCYIKLEPGQRFGLHGQDLFCESHYRNNMITSTEMSTGPNQRDAGPQIFSPPAFDKNHREIKQEIQMLREPSPSSMHVKEVLAKVQEAVSMENNYISQIPEPIRMDNHLLQYNNNNNESRVDIDFPSLSDGISSPGAGSLPDQDKNMSSGNSSSDDENLSRKINGKEAKRRSRTRFKQHQLLAMKDLFDMDKNPDSVALSTLSDRIGLKKRVLQVWFQNARAKSRKGHSIFSESIERILNPQDG